MNTRLLLAGTIPSESIDLVSGEPCLHAQTLSIADRHFSLNRGTAAMIAAACTVAHFFGERPPYCIIGGDIGRRDGSRRVYRHLIKYLPKIDAAVLGLHYIIPEIGLHNQVLSAVRKMHAKPILIADAGFMYVAKASGQAGFYDLFLPDIGELAFLADEKASHPAYTRGFLISLESEPHKLVAQAHAHRNVPAIVCVKGKADYIYKEGTLEATIDRPVIDTLEAIGGTGDTITGMAAGLVSRGISIEEACRAACTANRIAGELAAPTPATQIHEIIANIPRALQIVL